MKMKNNTTMFSTEDKASVKAWNDYIQKENLEYTKDIYDKVDLLTQLVDSLHTEDIKMEEWLTWSEPMIYKLVFHSSTLLQMFYGTRIYIKQKAVTIFDEPSVIMLMRVVLENYLTFFYLFCDNISVEEKKFRISVWKYCGLKQRTEFNISTIEAKEKQAQELLLVEEIKKEIGSSIFYLKLKKDEQSLLLKGKKPRLFYSWEKLIRISGLRRDLFKNLYGYKSSYAHSEFLSVLQIKSNHYGFKKEDKEHYVLFMIHMLICKSILDLTKLFASIKKNFEVLDKSIQAEIYFLNRFLTDSELDK